MNEQDMAIREFLAESYENLDQLERDLVTIEADPRNRETLDRIFRTVHSIKGACGFLAYPKLEAVAHAGEGLLCRLRDGELEWRPAITSGLLALSDAMRKIMGHIEDNGTEGGEDHTSLIDQLIGLQGLLDQSSEPAAIAPAEERNRAPESRQSLGICPEAPVTAVPSPEPVATTQEDWAGDNDSDKPSGSPSGGISSGNIRVDVGLLDKLMNLVGELVLARNQILQQANTHEDASLLGTSQRLNLITTELQEGVMKTRMQPIGNVWNKFPRVVRDLALACAKQVRVDLEGSETELDRTIIEAIKDPLTHLVRNAVDHGIELPAERLRRGKPASGCLRMRAFHESGQVNIEISDDGAGINVERITRSALDRGLISREQAARMGDHDLMQLIFLPGFSTAAQITNISGRGVGMDVVKTNIEKIGGTIDMQSTPGQGTILKIKIPLTLAIIPALIVNAGGDCFAIPQVNLLELVRLEQEQARHGIEMIHGAPVFRLRGSLLPLLTLDKMLNSLSADASRVGWRESAGGTTVDIKTLQEMHLRWKGRLMRFLDGQEDLDPDKLASPDQCDLGRWLNSPGVRRLANRPEYSRLIHVHNEMHALVKEVVVLHHSGKCTEAQASVPLVGNLSHEVVAALSGLERTLEQSEMVNIVVLQADGRRFGLVVDGINDTEEIVVKPLGKQLKGVSLFAGATIMGDGRVSLILDVAGTAQRAGVISGMTDRLAREEAARKQDQGDERSAYLLLKHGANGRVAIPLSLVARLEEIPCSAIEHSGGHEVVQYRNQIIPLVRLSQALNHRGYDQAEESDPMQVVVYTQNGQSVGLVVDTILDIVEDAIQMRPARTGQGLIGSAVIQQRVTDVVDLPGLIRTVAPDLVMSPIGVGD